MSTAVYKSNFVRFSGSEAIQFFKNNLFRYFEKSKLNPYSTEEWKKGIFQLFHIQTINLPDLDKENYILVSNHISDFDAVILGLLHPSIRIIAKIGWTNNNELMDFLNLHYNIVGIYRDFEIEKLNTEEKEAANGHNFKTNKDSFRYIKNNNSVHHLLIFPQSTISDINRNSKERVNIGFARIAAATKTGVINMFIEYPDINGCTRIVCGVPYDIPNHNLDCRQTWLNDVISLQNQLSNVREPVLSEKHSRNNNPDEPYF